EQLRELQSWERRKVEKPARFPAKAPNRQRCRRRRPCKRCAVSAQRRRCRSSLFCRTKLRERNDFLSERLEPRIAAKRNEKRINTDWPDIKAIALLITLLKPFESLIAITHAEINQSQ